MSIQNIQFSPAPYVWALDSFSQNWGILTQAFQLQFNPGDAQYLTHCLHQLHEKLDPHCRLPLSTILCRGAADPKVFLGVLLATCHHNLPEVNRLLTQVGPWDPSGCVREIYNLYFRSIIPKIENWVNSFPGKANRELLYTTELARLLAHDILDDTGQINRGVVEFWKDRAPIEFGFLPDLYKKQFGIMMNLLESDLEFQQLLLGIGPSDPLHQETLLTALRDPHLRPDGLTPTHARRAVLGALLSYPRQEESKDCFALALIIGLLQHNPKIILRHLAQYVSTGAFSFPNPLEINWKYTFHCPYELESMPSHEILLSPFFAPLFPFDRPDLSSLTPLAPSTPRAELKRVVQSRFPDPAQSEQARTSIRTGLNRLSSYFRQPLLQSLVAHSRTFADNSAVSCRQRIFLGWEQLFLHFPPLQPLKQTFFSLLNTTLLVRRIDDEGSLQHMESLGFSRQRILHESGQFCWFDPIRKHFMVLEQWEELRNAWIQTLKEAEKSHPNPLLTGVFTKFKQPDFLIWLKDTVVEAAGGPAFYPRDLYESRYCCLLPGGGCLFALASGFFQVHPKLCPLLPAEKPEEVLLALSTTFRQELSGRDPHPLVIGTHANAAFLSHAFTISPYAFTLHQLWGAPNPREKITETMHAVERRGKIPLLPQQRDFLAASIPRKLGEGSANSAPAIHPLSEIGITAEGVIQNWKEHLPPETLPVLQASLNEATELLPWNLWHAGFCQSIVRKLPPRVQTPEIATRMGQAVDAVKGESPFGMTIQRGAQVIHQTLQKAGHALEYGQVLTAICDEYAFPQRFQIGDLNFPDDSGRRELWIGPNYGDQQKPLRYLCSDGKGEFTPTVSSLTEHFVYILEKGAPPFPLYV